MILIDEMGTRIQATVKKDMIPRFDRFLEQGAVRIISNFGVAPNDAKYKFVEHPNKLNFYYNTKVTPCKHFDGSFYGFKFVDFDSILQQNIAKDVTFDLIGDVVSRGQFQTKYDDNGKKSRLIDIELQDLQGQKLKVTLWDDYGQQIHDYLKNPSLKGHVILIIQFCKMKNYNETTSISNTYYATRLFLNDDIDEIIDFKHRLQAKLGDDTSTHTLTELRGVPVYSLSQDFLFKHEIKTIDQLRATKEVGTYVVVGTIKVILYDQPWYYIGCQKCKKGVETGTGKALTCASCVDGKSTISTLFRIPVRVQDSTGAVTLTIFDRDACKLLHTTADDLCSKFQEDVDSITEQFDQMVDQTYAFKVKVATFNLQNSSHVYSISKLTDDEHIILQIKEKQDVDKPVKSESCPPICIDLSTQYRPSLKDAISCTGDNATPATIEKSTASSPDLKTAIERSTGSSPILKRKLEDSYTDDINFDMSSTKKFSNNLSENHEPSSSNKPTLLVPKIEK